MSEAYSFDRRWETIKTEAEELFSELYGKDSTALDRIKERLRAIHESRPPHLHKRDREKESDPHWHMSNQWVGMMLYIDRFAGKITDLEDKLEYLEELGVNVVHLMPFLKRRSGENDGGYAVSDYGQVDPLFGTNEELKALISEIHNRHGLVMMDMVLNHTADDHPWAQKAKAGDREYLDYYYHFKHRQEVEEYDPYMPEIFPDTAPGSFTYIAELDEWIMTVFYSYQWDLNFRNPRVLEEIIAALMNLANWGVDIIRLDAIIFIWKQQRTTCQNLPEVHKILRLIRLFTSCVAPGLLYVAEAIATKDEVIPYFGSEQAPESDFAYNTALMSCLWDALVRGNTQLLEEVYSGMPAVHNKASWLNYVRCHDDISMAFTDTDLRKVGADPDKYREETAARMSGDFTGSFSKGLQFMPQPGESNKRIASSLASLCGLEKALQANNKSEIDLAIRRIRLMHAIILSVGGLPMIYYGDELGLLNDYEFLEDEKKKLDTRWVSRPIINWEVAGRRKSAGTLEHRVFSDLERLISIRRSEPEFTDQGDFELLQATQEIFSYRRGRKEKILCFFYFGTKSCKIHLGDIHPEFTGGVSLIDEKKYHENEEMELKPYDFDWILLK